SSRTDKPKASRKKTAAKPAAETAEKPAVKKAAAKPRPTAKAKAARAPKGDGKPAKKTAPARAGGSAKSLVIVESPTKSRTLTKFLGRNFTVVASNGHIMDLPKSKLGVDLDNDFEPEYVPIRGKTQALTRIKTAARAADRIYLAPDPDREGEAIAWHL